MWMDALTKVFSKSKRRRSRDYSEFELQIFDPADVLNFQFFQYNTGNAQFFFAQGDAHPVSIEHTPHAQVARHIRSGDGAGQEMAERAYKDYLLASWPCYGISTHPKKIQAKYERFVELVELIQSTQQIPEPVLLTQLPGREDFFVVDGNHRCSIAAALQLPVEARVIDFPIIFDDFMRIDAFYGTSHRNLPYQSIYLDRQIVREGRRQDIYERLDMLPDGFLTGKSVIDLGCNIGMNAIGICQAGAAHVVGLEVNRQLVDYATRFAIFDGCHPQVRFEQFDLDKDRLDNTKQFDIAFMLSVHHHLKRPENLATIAQANVNDAVVFEGHPGTSAEDYTGFFQAVQFAEVVQIGELSESIFNDKTTRPLWICRKQKAA